MFELRRVYQCKSTYQESNVPACTGYDWPSDYQMMCSKDDLEKGEESAYFTVADDVVPMCYVSSALHITLFSRPQPSNELQL